MSKNKKMKPVKRTDKELWSLTEKRIAEKNYVIKSHAKDRQGERSITDIDILDILENKKNRKRNRNKKKDIYEEGYADWKYCIEGMDLDEENKIRVIISFDESYLLIITVIRLDNRE